MFRHARQHATAAADHNARPITIPRTNPVLPADESSSGGAPTAIDPDTAGSPTPGTNGRFVYRLPRRRSSRFPDRSAKYTFALWAPRVRTPELPALGYGARV